MHCSLLYSTVTMVSSKVIQTSALDQFPLLFLQRTTQSNSNNKPLYYIIYMSTICGTWVKISYFDHTCVIYMNTGPWLWKLQLVTVQFIFDYKHMVLKCFFERKHYIWKKAILLEYHTIFLPLMAIIIDHFSM